MSTRLLDRPPARRAVPVLLLALLTLAMLLAIAGGAASIPVPTALRLLTAGALGGTISPDELTAYRVIWEIRTPRVVLAALVGAGLGSLGVATQALVRNPLADPFLLGISSGASVGASAVIALGWFTAWGTWGLSIAAFVGALGAAAAVMLFTRSRDGIAPLRLVLVGVVLAYGFQSVMSFIVFLEPRGDAARAVMFWLMGSLGGANWSQVPLVTGVVLATVVLLWRWASALDVLALGDATAASMGVDADAVRRRLFVLSALATGVLVAVSGAIGFVGLVVPHLVRLVVGPSHRRVMLLAPLVGAIFLVAVDYLSRVLMPPRELPLGVMTAALGVPVFLVLVRRRGYTFGGAR